MKFAGPLQKKNTKFFARLFQEARCWIARKQPKDQCSDHGDDNMITVQRGSRQSQGHHGEHTEGGDGQATGNGGSDDQILTWGQNGTSTGVTLKHWEKKPCL